MACLVHIPLFHVAHLFCDIDTIFRHCSVSLASKTVSWYQLHAEQRPLHDLVELTMHTRRIDVWGAKLVKRFVYGLFSFQLHRTFCTCYPVLAQKVGLLSSTLCH